MDAESREHTEWNGRIVTLQLSDPRFNGREAICSSYNHEKERLVVWVLPSGEEILVRIASTFLTRVHTTESCRRLSSH